MVTTDAVTLEAFLLPYADHYRAEGWTVDAAASNIAARPGVVESFDAVHDAGWSRSPWDPANLPATARLRGILRTGRYDIVHVHTPVAGFLTRLAAKTLRPAGRPSVVYTAHGFHFYRGADGAKTRVYRTAERIAAPWTDQLVVINSEDFEAAISVLGMDPDHVHHFRGIGVDIARYTPREADRSTAQAVYSELGVPEGSATVLAVGELISRKRLDTAIRALAAMPSGDAHLVLAGEGPRQSDLSLLASQLGVSDRVHFAGFRFDVPVLLSGADLLVLPSLHEGLPRAVLEAMVAGVPVVAADIRGCRDLLAGDPECLSTRRIRGRSHRPSSRFSGIRSMLRAWLLRPERMSMIMRSKCLCNAMTSCTETS